MLFLRGVVVALVVGRSFCFSGVDLVGMSKLFVPCKGEVLEPEGVEVVAGKIPLDFPRGAYLRVGPNDEDADGQGAFLDGFGLVHCVRLDGEASRYSRSYVKSRAYEKQLKANKKFKGTLEAAPFGYPLIASLLKNALNFGQAQADTCNTAICVHGKDVMAAMEQAPPTKLQVFKDGRLETVENFCDLTNSKDPIYGPIFAAHGRVCPVTSDYVTVSYASTKPYARVDVFGPDGFKDLKKTAFIDDMPIPSMIHDSAITNNHVVVLDQSLVVQPKNMLVNKFPVGIRQDNQARIGLMSRTTYDKVQWFDCEPYVALHCCNAFERPDGTVVIQAFRSEPKAAYLTDYTTSQFYEWILDPATGKLIKERQLNDMSVEFPAIDPRHIGQATDRVFAARVKSYGGPIASFKAPNAGILMDAVIAFDTSSGDVVDDFTLPDATYLVSEPTFVNSDETNSAFIVVLTTDTSASMKSHMLILDAKNLKAGPMATLKLPYHVPYGLHSAFVPEELLV